MSIQNTVEWAVRQGTFASGTTEWGRFTLLPRETVEAAAVAGHISFRAWEELRDLYGDADMLFIFRAPRGSAHVLDSVSPVESYRAMRATFDVWLDAHALKTGDR